MQGFAGRVVQPQKELKSKSFVCLTPPLKHFELLLVLNQIWQNFLQGMWKRFHVCRVATCSYRVLSYQHDVRLM